MAGRHTTRCRAAVAAAAQRRKSLAANDQRIKQHQVVRRYCRGGGPPCQKGAKIPSDRQREQRAPEPAGPGQAVTAVKRGRSEGSHAHCADWCAAGPAAADRQGREPVPAAGLSSVHIKQQESVTLERLPRGVDTVKAGASPARPPRAVVAASLRRRLGC